MAWTNSKVFAATQVTLGTTNNVDLDTDTLKAALYNNSVTPDNTVTAANTAYNAGVWGVANEVDDGTNWDAGGEPLTSVTYAIATGAIVELDAADTPQGGASTTLANVYGCLVYSDTATVVADQGVCYIYFGGVQSVTAGDFTIVWNANGIYRIDAT